MQSTGRCPSDLNLPVSGSGVITVDALAELNYQLLRSFFSFHP